MHPHVHKKIQWLADRYDGSSLNRFEKDLTYSPSFELLRFICVFPCFLLVKSLYSARSLLWLRVVTCTDPKKNKDHSFPGSLWRRATSSFCEEALQVSFKIFLSPFFSVRCYYKQKTVSNLWFIDQRQLYGSSLRGGGGGVWWALIISVLLRLCSVSDALLYMLASRVKTRLEKTVNFWEVKRKYIDYLLYFWTVHCKTS